MKRDELSTFLQGLFATIIVIGGLFLFSKIYTSCMGAIARESPDNGEYFATDDWDYYHKSICACVGEHNVGGSFDSREEAEDAGLEPCPYCISEDE